MLTLDFSPNGWKAALKEFFVSAFKTALVAVVAYAGFKLSNVHIDLGTQNAEIYTLLLVVGRALVSSISVWATTLPGTVSTTTFPDGSQLTSSDPLV